MALPKLETQTYTLTLPSTGKKLKFRPFLMKEQKVLMIAQESEEDEQMQEAIANVVRACTFEKIDPWTCPAFDLEYIFIKLRGKSVGESVELNVLCPDDNETRATIKVQLDEVECMMHVGHTNEVNITDEIKLIMKYPTLKDLSVVQKEKSTETEKVFKMLHTCIQQIIDGDTIHQDIDIPDGELSEFLDTLTAQQLEGISNFFETMPKLSHTIKVKNPKTKKTGEVVIEGFENFFE